MKVVDKNDILIEKYGLSAFDRVIEHGILTIFKKVSTWLDLMKIWAYFGAILCQNDPKRGSYQAVQNLVTKNSTHCCTIFMQQRQT